ncbi:MAG: DNA polymerase III subunit alpha [Spirochaetes bacterium]|nr:DNA polymerase III subunit alpha [Spirochaetota bacterium]
MITTPFIHLHNHTEFSLLDGACKVKKLVKKTIDFGMPGVAITDHGNIFGAIKFYEECKSVGIKPIIGQEFYISENSRFDKSKDNKTFHLVLIALDKEGYKNLIKLSSLAYIEGFYKKPRIDIELLKKYNKGLICLTACLLGEVPYYAKIAYENKNYENKLKNVISKYLDIFGNERFFLELMDHGIEDQIKIGKKFLEISEIYGLNMVITNDNHFISKEESSFHDLMLAVQTQDNINNKDRFKFESDQMYFKSYEEMKNIFNFLPDNVKNEAFKNTIKIFEMVNLELEFGKYFLPDFKVPENLSQKEYLRKIAEDGLKKKYKEITDEIRNRFEYEFSVIEKMGFIGYFLIVWDIIKWSKDHGILVGPGRGSAGGSILAYALDITDIDPIKYNLLFERFLNPDRISMPDIDIDIQDTKRDKVIQHLKDLYGENHVCNINALNKLKAKNAIRDAARALGYSAEESLYITKLMGDDDLSTEYELNEQFRNYIDKDEKNKNLFENAKFLENQYRQTSLHAAGVVITPDEITELIPVYVSSQEQKIIASQYDKDDLEKLGFLKMDILGLGNLTIIEETIKNIKINKNKNIVLSEINLNDEKTFNLLKEGNTIGVFQFESTGMIKLLKKLKPDSIEDISVALALYRPGPIKSGYLDMYIERKHDKSKIEYPFESLKSVLQETYGILVYQEQIMKTAMILSGFTGGQADILRKAIGKKQGTLIEKLKKDFIEGAVKNGYLRDKVEKLYNDIENFASYCFNKSHSVAYAHISYITAYLKANYPLEYMTAILNYNLGIKIEDFKIYLEDTKLQNIKILEPDINKSDIIFKIEGKNIRYGLSAIKGVGEAVAQYIIEEREKNGLYKNFIDFIKRVNKSKVNKKVLETLISIGSFDFCNIRREILLEILPEILEYFEKNESEKNDLFTSIDINKDEIFFKNLVNSYKNKVKLWDQQKFFEIQLEYLGDFITISPFDNYLREIFYYNSYEIDELIYDENYNNKKIQMIGYIEKIQRKKNKDNKEFFIVFVNFYFFKTNIFVFQNGDNSTYNKIKELEKENDYSLWNFEINIKRIPERKEAMLILSNIHDKDSIIKAPLKKIKILIDKNFEEMDIKKIKTIIKENPGKTEVYLKVENEIGILKLNNSFDDSKISLFENIKSIKELIKS